MILSDGSLLKLLPQLVRDPDVLLINPASVDIRVGRTVKLEVGYRSFHDYDLGVSGSVDLLPGHFALVSTFEHVTVPNGYAVELKLKSSRAREGYDHSLAFWVDSGWDGILTMEVKNVTRFQVLPLALGMRFGQMIVHQLDQPALNPYRGRYHGATGVEESKA